MTRGKTIYTIVIVVLAIIADFLVLNTKSYFGPTVNFSVQSGDIIQVVGSNKINVVATGLGYMRIVVDDTGIKGEPKSLKSTNFIAQGELHQGNWNILDGSSMKITAIADNNINVAVSKPASTWGVVIFLTTVVVLMLYVLWGIFKS